MTGFENSLLFTGFFFLNYYQIAKCTKYDRERILKGWRMSGYCEVLRLLRNRGGEGFDTLAWEKMSSSFIEAEIWEPAG